jgi:hypothetical protein
MTVFLKLLGFCVGRLAALPRTTKIYLVDRPTKKSRYCADRLSFCFHLLPYFITTTKMHSRASLAISTACLTFVFQCLTVPVNDFIHNLPDVKDRFPLTIDGRWQTTTKPVHHELLKSLQKVRQEEQKGNERLNRQISHWVHPELAQMFQQAGTSHQHATTSGKEMLHPPSPEPILSSSHDDSDSLWAIVGESSQKFGAPSNDKGSKISSKQRSSNTLRPGRAFGISRGYVHSSNDPQHWKYNLNADTIVAIHAKYRELVGEKRGYSSLYKYFENFATQKDALLLLSKDVKVQQAAFKRIGMPLKRQKSLREHLWGRNKDKVVNKIHRLTGISRNVLSKELGRNIHKELADKLLSNVQ